MDEKYIIVVVIIVGVILINWRVGVLMEEARVGKMHEICRVEYNKTYSHHDEYHFYCFDASGNESLDLVQVQWNEDYQRPFEPPTINFSGFDTT